MHKIFYWVKARYQNVWTTKYPKYGHIVSLILGIASSIAFIINFEGTILIKIALFFPLSILGYLCILAFTYGIIRSRKAWTKKRK